MIGGPGGVGKTTLSAALAVALANRGYETVCLTVDPARRLAQALGLDSLDNELRSVSNHLSVSQLGVQRFLDQLITRIARSEHQRERILKNPIYSMMASHLGGTQEYAAMERILEFAENSRFEKIVVDTPPTQNAVDLLTAPKRIFDFMDNSVLKWFTHRSGAFGGILNRGTALAMKALQQIIGSDFFDMFEGFLKDIDGLQDGFRSRNQSLMNTLRADQTAFCLVTLATQERFRECCDVAGVLKSERIALRAILMNQLEPEPPLQTQIFDSKGLVEWVGFCRAIFEAQKSVLQRFDQAHFPLLLRLERLDRPPDSLADLSRLGDRLLDYPL